MPIDKSLLEEYESSVATIEPSPEDLKTYRRMGLDTYTSPSGQRYPLAQDYFSPPPPKKKSLGINKELLESFEAGEHEDVKENKSKLPPMADPDQPLTHFADPVPPTGIPDIVDPKDEDVAMRKKAYVPLEEKLGIPEIFKGIREMIAPTTPYTQEESDRMASELGQRIVWMGKYVPTFGGRLGGKNFRKRLLEEAESFAGFGPAIAPAAGEMGTLALEWGVVYPYLFKAVGLGGAAVSKIPRVAKATAALKKAGGLTKIAEKFPRHYARAVNVLKAMGKGTFVGGFMGGIETIGKDMEPGEILQHTGKRAAIMAGVAGTFRAVSEVDTAIYTRRLRTALIKASNSRFANKVREVDAMVKSTAKTAAYKSLTSLKKAELQAIDKIVSATEANLLGLKKNKLYQLGQEVVERPDRAAQRLMKYGLEKVGEVPKGIEKLTKGLGKTEPFIQMPLTRTAEAIESTRELGALLRKPSRIAERILRTKLPAKPTKVTPPPVIPSPEVRAPEAEKPPTEKVREPAEHLVALPKAKGAREIEPAKGETILIENPEVKGDYQKYEDFGTGILRKGNKLYHKASLKEIEKFSTVKNARKAAQTLAQEDIDFELEDVEKIKAQFQQWQKDKGDIEAYLTGAGEELEAKDFPEYMQAWFFKDRSTQFGKPRDIALANLKNFVSEVPEFALNPVLTYKEGYLVFSDGYRFKFVPDYFGINKESLVEGDKIHFDLENLGIKKPSAKKLKAAEIWTGEPKIMGRVAEKPIPVERLGREVKPRKLTAKEETYERALVDIETGKEVEVEGGVTYKTVSEQDIRRVAELGRKAGRQAWTVERDILGRQERGTAETKLDIGDSIKIIRNVFAAKPLPKEVEPKAPEKIEPLKTYHAEVELPNKEKAAFDYQYIEYPKTGQHEYGFNFHNKTIGDPKTGIIHHSAKATEVDAAGGPIEYAKKWAAKRYVEVQGVVAKPTPAKAEGKWIIKNNRGQQYGKKVFATRELAQRELEKRITSSIARTQFFIEKVTAQPPTVAKAEPVKKITSGYPPKEFEFTGRWSIQEQGYYRAERNKQRIKVPIYKSADGEEFLYMEGAIKAPKAQPVAKAEPAKVQITPENIKRSITGQEKKAAQELIALENKTPEAIYNWAKDDEVKMEAVIRMLASTEEKAAYTIQKLLTDAEPEARPEQFVTKEWVKEAKKKHIELLRQETKKLLAQPVAKAEPAKEVKDPDKYRNDLIKKWGEEKFDKVWFELAEGGENERFSDIDGRVAELDEAGRWNDPETKRLRIEMDSIVDAELEKREAKAKPKEPAAKMPEHTRTDEGLVVIESDIGEVHIPEGAITGEYGKDLETIFYYGNFQSETPQPRLKRSLSVGDTVKYKGHALMIMPQGWRDVTGLSDDAIEAIQTSKNAIGLAASWRVAEKRLSKEKEGETEERSEFIPPAKPKLSFYEEDLIPRSADVKHIKNVVVDTFREWPKGIKKVGKDYWTEVMAVAKQLATPYRYKALRQTMLGVFRHKKKPVPQVVGIEVQDVTDALTATHELAHNIDWLLNNKIFPSSIKKRFPNTTVGEMSLRNELKKISKILRPDAWERPKAYIKSHVELMADYISHYILEPEKTRELAPNITRAFEAKLAAKPELFDTISRLQESRYTGPEEPPIAKHIREVFPLPKEFTPLKLAIDMTKDSYVKAAEELGITAARHYKLLIQRAQREADRIDELVSDKARQTDLVVVAEKGSKNPWTGKTRQEILKDALTANEKKAIKLFRAYQEKARQTVNKYLRGADIAEYIKFIEDYFIHAYETPLTEKYKTAIARWAKRSPQAKKRVLPDLAKSVEIGLKPRAKTLSEGLKLWAGINYRVMTNKAFLRVLPQITNDDGVSILQKPLDYPSWPTVDYWPIRQNYAIPLPGRGVLLFQGRVAVDPRVKPFIDAMFGRKVFNTPVRIIEGLNATWKAFELTLFSFFHHQAEFFSAAGSLGPRALPFVGGYYGKRAQVFGKKKLFGFLPVHIATLKAGKQLEKTPEFMDDYLAHGGQRGYISTEGINLMERSLKRAADYLENIIQYRPTTPLTGVYAAAYVHVKTAQGIYSFHQKLLWDNVNRAKLVSYYQIVADGAKSSDLPIKEVKEIAVKYINDNFGGQEWLNTMFRNRKTRQFWTQLMMSLDWTWSQIKTARWPFGIGVKGKERRAFMRKIGRHHWFWYISAIAGFTIAGSYAMSGKFPWENEKGHELDIDWTKIWRSLPWNKDWKERGDYNRRYIGLGKAGRELVRWVTSPLRAFGYKLSPVARSTFEQTTGYNVGSDWAEPWAREDLEGYQEMYARFKHLMENFVPFAFSGNNAFLAFPSRKGMTRWKATRAYEEIYKARAIIALGGIGGKIAKANQILKKDEEKLKAEIAEACKLNNVDADQADRAALSGVRSKYYSLFWKATEMPEKKAVSLCNAYANALHELGITPKGFKQSLMYRIKTLPERARDIGFEAIQKAAAER